MLWLLPAKNKKHTIDVPHGYLITPYGGGKHALESNNRFGVDNDSYTGKFDRDKFLRLLDKIAPHKDRCLFINPPDVVGNAIQTTNLYHEWYTEIKGRELPISYILQDGCVGIPDLKPNALFVGGSTEFKLSQWVLKLLQVVKSDYWIHIGRVNTLRRLLHFRYVADSFDGTQAYRFQPDIGTKYIRNSLRFIDAQMELIYEEI
jgi:hypothetical protein